MFKTILGENKTAEVEFRDQEKFRSIPSLALPAICFLDEYLTKDMRVFEWGSGASTIFFAMRCGYTVSIEHDERWNTKVVEALAYRWDGQPGDEESYNYLQKPHNGYDPDFCSQQPGYDSVNFKMYVETIEMFPYGFFDIILVDGRARCACLKSAQPKLKSGGILVLDDSARSIYQHAMSEIDWPVIHFEGCIPFYKHGHTVRTTIWVKE